MTVGKAAALTAGFVGAVALGVAVGPQITERMSDRDTASMQAPAAVSQPAQPEARARVNTRSATKNAPAAKASAPVAIAANAVRADEPRVHTILKPVLNRGTRMEVAAEGFLTAEEFATVAHAARNTQVPFMVLKHRVLSEKQPFTESIADAIQEYKPDLDAKAEVERARMEAKVDLAEISN
jgi:hypothetical protein